MIKYIKNNVLKLSETHDFKKHALQAVFDESLLKSLITEKKIFSKNRNIKKCSNSKRTTLKYSYAETIKAKKYWSKTRYNSPKTRKHLLKLDYKKNHTMK